MSWSSSSGVSECGAEDKENEETEISDALPATPKTPEKRHPVKHVENIETPFRLNIKRKKDGSAPQTPRRLVFDDSTDIEKEREWFRKKRGGRKSNPFKFITHSAVAIGKSAWPVCPVQCFFDTHFEKRALLHTSSESLVHLVEEKSRQERACDWCAQRDQNQEEGISLEEASLLLDTRESASERMDSSGIAGSSFLLSSGQDGIDTSFFGCRPFDPFAPQRVPQDAPGPSLRVVKQARRTWTTPKEKREKVREAKFLHRLRKSPYVTDIHRAWEEGGILYIEMLYCNQGTLANYLKKLKGPDALRLKLLVVSEITRGIKAVHKARIVHMDVKTSNIYIHKDEKKKARVKIGDFGISRDALDTSDIEFDGDGKYMAPEVLQNTCSYASDIYSLGIVFREVLGPDLEPDPASSPAQSTQSVSDEGDRTRSLIQELIARMTREVPGERPSISEVLLCIQNIRARA